MASSRLINRVKRRREAAGLSQSALATRAGISRQALIAIEAGRQVPSTTLSLQLANVLGCRVEHLFQIEPTDGFTVTVAPCADYEVTEASSTRCTRVTLGKVAGRMIAHRIAHDAYASADGIVIDEPQGQNHSSLQRDNGYARARNAAAGIHEPPPALCGTPALVRPFVGEADIERNVFVAGCAPLLGPLAQRTAMRYRDIRVTWIPANSRRALDLLDAGMVHVAGLHLSDERAGKTNVLAIRERFPTSRVLVVNLTRWRQGFLVPKGNPLAIQDAGDLLRPGIRFAHRERGSGATKLLHQLLVSAGAEPDIAAPRPWALGHSDIAQLVRCGAADVGVAIESVAIAAGLDFIPLAAEQFDLVLPAQSTSDAPVARLIDTLDDAAFRSEVEQLPGYDPSMTGHTITLGGA